VFFSLFAKDNPNFVFKSVVQFCVEL